MRAIYNNIAIHDRVALSLYETATEGDRITRFNLAVNCKIPA